MSIHNIKFYEEVILISKYNKSFYKEVILMSTHNICYYKENKKKCVVKILMRTHNKHGY